MWNKAYIKKAYVTVGKGNMCKQFKTTKWRERWSVIVLSAIKDFYYQGLINITDKILRKPQETQKKILIRCPGLINSKRNSFKYVMKLLYLYQKGHCNKIPFLKLL